MIFPIDDDLQPTVYNLLVYYHKVYICTIPNSILLIGDKYAKTQQPDPRTAQEAGRVREAGRRQDIRPPEGSLLHGGAPQSPGDKGVMPDAFPL